MTISLKEGRSSLLQANAGLKGSLKYIYRSMPFKRKLFTILRDKFGVHRLPYSYLRYLAFKGPFTIKTENAGFLMVNGYGFEIEASLFWKGANSFETETMKIWKMLAKSAKNIIDVGANTGVYTLFAKDANPHAHVYAFEPIERVFSHLDLNRRINKQRKFYFDFKCYRIALSDYSGQGMMYDLPVEHMYTASLNKNVHEERGQQLQALMEAVQVMRIDDFLHENSIDRLDLVKIDVESHEPAVIRGIGSFLVSSHPSMIVEIWNNDVGKKVEEALGGCSYLYFAINENGPKLVPHIENDYPEMGYINYLICTKEIAIDLKIV